MIVQSIPVTLGTVYTIYIYNYISVSFPEIPAKSHSITESYSDCHT